MCSVVVLPDSPGPAALTELEQLEREICDLAAHLAAGTCRWLLLVAEFDERGGWEQAGTLSCAHWLSWRVGIGLRTAREHVRVARALGGLPLLTEAFARGELSYSKMRALTRVATPQTEADLLMIARHGTGAHIENLVRGYSGVLRANSEEAMAAQQRQHLDCVWEDDGMLRVAGRLTAENGMLLLAALAQVPAEPVAEAERDERPTPGQQRAEALMAVVRGEAQQPAELVVHVDAESLADEQLKGQCELEAGPVLAPETARRLGCDASVVRIIERDGKPLSVGRRRRTVPPALRRALRSRDGGCRFPGCTNTKFLHAHHIRHWARGGPTDLDNLVQLCTRHHQLVHEGGYLVEPGADGRLSFRRPDGRPIPAAGPCTPARGPGVQQQNRARGLAVDDRTCSPKTPGDRLDYDIAVEGLCRRQLGPPGSEGR